MTDKADTLDTAELRPGTPVADVTVPRLELLFHPQLTRIGEATRPDAFDQGPLLLGRRSPGFGDDGRPLADPFVSREQCTLRWSPDTRTFELTPGPAPQRQLAVLTPGSREAAPVSGPLRLAPGTTLALGERALVLLTCGRPRPAEADRLDMAGESEAMWQVREQIGALARFHESVLVLGETGTGKELIARALHRLGGAQGPFVALNMGGIEAGTAGSELFGHVRGSFTGAVRDVAGAFERARRGTLFLDEIGDLAPELQKKLLRVLEDRRFSPLGSSQTLDLQCRVVAATHCPLLAEVSAGRFRRDLYERLGALTLAVPPLRQRREDIPRLFVRFLAQQVGEHPGLAWLLAGASETRPKAAGEPALDCADARGAPPIPLAFFIELLARPWDGNIRELRNAATAVAAANLDGRRFVAPPAFAAPPEEPAGGARAAPTSRVPTAEQLSAALVAAGGNVSAAASALGCSRHQFYRWAHARGLDLDRLRGG